MDFRCVQWNNEFSSNFSSLGKSFGLAVDFTRNSLKYYFYEVSSKRLDTVRQKVDNYEAQLWMTKESREIINFNPPFQSIINARACVSFKLGHLEKKK